MPVYTFYISDLSIHDPGTVMGTDYSNDASGLEVKLHSTDHITWFVIKANKVIHFIKVIDFQKHY
jgi:hypothetical protein